MVMAKSKVMPKGQSICSVSSSNAQFLPRKGPLKSRVCKISGAEMEGLGSYGASAARPAAAGQPATQQLPKHLRDVMIWRFSNFDLYQSQLAELNACHSLLTVDQERLATMLAPYVNASGELVMEAPDPDVMLFKQGLDLRLKEFEEDCKRIQQTEQKLQDQIDSAASDYEQVDGNFLLEHHQHHLRVVYHVYSMEATFNGAAPDGP
eukprot:s2166_g11.t1